MLKKGYIIHRVKNNEKFWYVDSGGEVCNWVENRNVVSDKAYYSGNYFKTEEEAKESKFYKVFHEEE